jgi:hypothetical protein
MFNQIGRSVLSLSASMLQSALMALMRPNSLNHPTVTLFAEQVYEVEGVVGHHAGASFSSARKSDFRFFTTPRLRRKAVVSTGGWKRDADNSFSAEDWSLKDRIGCPDRIGIGCADRSGQSATTRRGRPHRIDRGGGTGNAPDISPHVEAAE